MALTGSLQDLSIVDLLQFPHMGRKSGELIITSEQLGSCRFYYRQGNLVHAINGNSSGMDVLVKVISLNEGEFEFRHGIDADTETIELDLHHAVMLALATVDEQSKEQEAREEASPLMEYMKYLGDHIRKNEWVQYAGLIGDDAEILVEMINPEWEPQGTDQLTASLIQMMRSYPREGVKRICINDDDGHVFVQKLANGLLLMVIAGISVPMGQISIGVTKLAEQIESFEG